MFYINSVKVNNNYVYKRKGRDNSKLFSYLKSKGFNYFLEPIEYNDKYYIYNYIKTNNISKKDKAYKLVDIISLLHNKTTNYQDIDQVNIKNIYDEIVDKISSLKKYYYELQDYIESKVYMSPGECLLIENISKFYKILDISNTKINNWFNLKKESNRERTVIIHNNLSLDHFLYSINSFIISWDKSREGYASYDFSIFYRAHFYEIDFMKLFHNYQDKFKYNYDELLLFQALITIPLKVNFLGSNYQNSVNVRRCVNYVDYTLSFILEYDKEYENADKDKFNEEDKSI